MPSSQTERDGLVVPLIRTPGEIKSPPRHAFQIRNRTETEEGGGVASSLVSEVTNPPTTTSASDYDRARNLEREQQKCLVKMLGRPYARDSSFWYLEIPVSILLGGAVGLASVAFLSGIQFALDLWYNPQEEKLDLASGDVTKVIVIVAIGSFVSGTLQWLLPTPRSIQIPRNLIHSLTDLKEEPFELLTSMLASGIALVIGAPLGPEYGLTAIACALGIGFSSLVGAERRAKMKWIQTSLAASWPILLPGPLLGPLLVQELTKSVRPTKVTLDSVQSQEATMTQQETNVSTLKPDESDYMEGFTLQVLASVACSAVVQTIYPSAVALDGFSQISKEEFARWHFVAAAPIGVGCAIVSSVALLLICLFRGIRRKYTKQLQRAGAPYHVCTIVFPSVAGLILGTLLVLCPRTASSGMVFIQQGWNSAIGGGSIPSTDFLVLAITIKIFGLAVCLGFGLVGGLITPLMTVGLWVALLISNVFPSATVSLTVPCCIAACPVALCPFPLTGALATMIIFGCSVEQTGTVLVACISAWSVTGGTGMIRRLGQSRNSSLSEVEQDDAIVSDDELLRDIRAMIFGTG